MEHIHATYHRWLIHERQLVHCPRNAAKFGIHLDQYLGDDRSQILATLDSGRQNHLGGNGELGQKELLDVIVQVALAFGAGEEENYHLHTFIKLLFQRLNPGVDAHSTTNLNHVG